MADRPDGLTPMMRQYRDLKRRFPDHLLLFRLGDFYELFLEDAVLGARLLGITLTHRQDASMAGIPHHAADGYLALLVRAGQKIAVCEQLESPGQGRKLLRRDVFRILTPGTITDAAYLGGPANNFLLAVAAGREGTGVALLDVSTGDFSVGEDPPEARGVVEAALLRGPREIVLADRLRGARALHQRLEPKASTALSKMGDEAVAPLIRILEDDDWRVRGAAAWALGNIRNQEALPPLIKAMQDDSGFVRGGAAWALGQLGGEEAEKALEAALEDKSGYVRKVAQNYLSRG